VGLSEEQNEAVTDMLLNGEARVGGSPGVSADPAMYDLLYKIGLTGRCGTFTRRGADLARREQIDQWGELG
jgi:hypothetical protein